MCRILIILLFVTVSCDKNFKAPKPDNLIEQPVMEKILYDIKLLQASKSKKFKVLKDNNVQSDVYIYQKYKIDSITLRQNIAYYATVSFKKRKEIEERIRLQFVANKEAIGEEAKEMLEEKKIEDGVKKVKDSLRFPKEKFKEKLKNDIIHTQDLMLSNNYKEWVLVHSTLKEEKSAVRGNKIDIIKLLANNNNNQHRVDIPTKLLEGRYEFSVYAKKAEMGFVRLRIGTTGYPVVFDLINGSVIGEQEGVVANITEKESGWFKCSIKCSVAKVSVVRVNIFSSNSVSDFSGNEIEGVYLREVELKKIENR